MEHIASRADEPGSKASVRTLVGQARQMLEGQRPSNRLTDAAFRSVQIHSESGGGLLAGAIAFRLFMFLVPYVFVIVMGLGLGADIAGAEVRDVARRAGIAGVAATAIDSAAHASTFARWFTFGTALVALVLGARTLMKTLWVAHALIWKIPLHKPRHATRAGLELIGIFAAAIVLLRVMYAIRGFSFVAWVLGLALFSLVPASVWLVCSLRLFPAPPGITWRDMWPGAVVFGLGMQALHFVTVFWFARTIQSKSQAYGAIGAALTILLWAYMLGRLVTQAAALNAALWRSQRGEAGPSFAPSGGR